MLRDGPEFCDVVPDAEGTIERDGRQAWFRKGDRSRI
jgi:hypothetical protein